MIDITYFILGALVGSIVIPTISNIMERWLKPQIIEVDEIEEEIKEELPMKKIPEKFHLDEDDIKEAIKEWLYNNHDVDTDDVTVTLNVEHKQEQPDTPYRGGMSDWIDKAIFSAVAEKDA